jgi:hypothetical protein
MSGLGKAFDAAQARYDNLAPPEDNFTDDEEYILVTIDDVIDRLGRAERALRAGDRDLCEALMLEAACDLRAAA